MKSSPPAMDNRDCAPSAAPLLAVRGLAVHFHARGGPRSEPLRAVDDVSFQVPHGSSFGIVGESGSGKSTLLRAILRLVPATGGEVLFDGVDVLRLNQPALRALRPKMQIVFQDPAGSLNPRLRVENIIGEAALVHGLVRGRRALRERVAQMLMHVGLPPEVMQRYPHEFSGGQRQRIGIARALCLAPRLLLLDEPTSALDVSVQAEVLELLGRLRRELGLTYVLVSHNLAVVRWFCDETAVMQRGRIVEQAPTAALFASPQAAYTRELLDAVLEPEVPAGPAAR